MNPLPMRITFDFSRLDNLPQEVRSYLTKQCIVAGEFFTTILSVTPIAGNNTVPSGAVECGTEIVLSDNDKSFGFQNSDLHLFVATVN